MAAIKSKHKSESELLRTFLRTQPKIISLLAVGITFHPLNPNYNSYTFHKIYYPKKVLVSLIKLIIFG